MSDLSKPRKPHKTSSVPFKSLTSPKMPRKSLLKPTLATAIMILSFYLLFSFFFSNPPNLPSHSTSDLNKLAVKSGPPIQSPAKIFLYNLPRKFTYGVIESYLAARNSPSTDLKYPGNQHSAEWYLFSDLIFPDRVNSPVVRVFDPEDADLFYVPFFSSLSLVVNPPGKAPGAYNDEGMQEDLMEWLEEQVYWKRNLGWDHVFICQDPNALYKVIDRVKNGVLLVSDFGRLNRGQASLVKDVILPYSHRINPFNGEAGVDRRKSLLFFMGNRYRKEGGKVRDTLFQILEKEPDVIIKHGTQSRESRRMATQGMHSSKFCLHPAGDTPSACRLFDAIVSLCIPVIISDHIELPFEDVIDYTKIAIFVDTATAVQPGYLASLLRTIRTDRILQFQKELKAVTRYFEYEDKNGTVNEIWREVASKLPLIRLMINRDKRLVQRELPGLDCSCLCSSQNGTSSNL
ncbi:probable arabinosyltransferase ARAD1 [Aristolochia californica]|uniref:probable arabinosyltransferase ARAD1 n=1 Tax=Aristolochia californica TaxID=171875 RepID=UPI0035DE784E